MAKDSKLGTQPKTDIKIESETEKPLDVNGRFYDKSLDEPLVKVAINNPFSKILHWLDDLRRKQTTIFTLRLKIPLLALPLFIAVLGGSFSFIFNLGQQQARLRAYADVSPSPIIVTEIKKVIQPVRISRGGIIKATYQLLPSPTTITSLNNSGDTQPDLSVTPTIIPSPTKSPFRFILVDNSDRITFLTNTSFLSLYQNKKVLVTGMYDSSKNTLTIEKSVDIELLD